MAPDLCWHLVCNRLDRQTARGVDRRQPTRARTPSEIVTRCPGDRGLYIPRGNGERTGRRYDGVATGRGIADLIDRERIPRAPSCLRRAALTVL